MGVEVASIARIELLTAELPFRFSFGHALADRHSSTNVYVKIVLDDGTVGFGEGVPRAYVTGETAEGAITALRDRYVPTLLGRELPSPDAVTDMLDSARQAGSPVSNGTVDTAAWCALELALLDAAGRRFHRSVGAWLGPYRASVIQYSAVIPFTRPRQLAMVALLIRLAGMRHVKVKVGNDLDADLRALRLLRRILGPHVDLRVDANCAWTAKEALAALALMRPYGISAVEQPVRADDLEGLRQITAETPEMIIVDESLRTVDEATVLAEKHACDAFNIRVSKCGGLLNSVRIARIADQAALTCIVGAQVGESGLLSAAGRHLAASIGPPVYVEGSAGRLLLREDLTEENVLPGRKGRARPYRRDGLGVHVKEPTLKKYGRVQASLQTAPAKVGQV
jgi:muconate cycloisomerase